jgi:glycosyltransferase involved in cell wall biosynthesis
VGDKTFQSDSVAVHTSQLPTHRPVARIFWEQFIQPLALRRAGVDLLHAMAFVAPLAAPCPFVVTVYDLSFLRFPEAFRPFNRWYLSRFTAHSVRRAKAVITISESTRQDVITLLGAPPERVHTIYCGVDDSFHPLPADEVTQFRAARHLPESFLLYLGTLEPRKNIDGLLRAYALWREQAGHAPPLVIAGGKGWYYAQIFELVEALALTGQVIFPGYVSQAELPLWYNAATAFVYPSHFEGFGLPVLEAMACGTPVITSTASSLPEVAGPNGAACLINPADTAALAQAMAAVMSQPDLRRDMAQQGRARAGLFRWEKTARQTVNVYQKALTP